MKEITDYTKYEKARMIGSRSLQLAMGAPFLIKLSKAELEKINYNPIKIAQIELEQEVLPITVKRPLSASEKKKSEEALGESN
tara:strand:+ start:229 stop:477 length:249 start_codon:yes stop_codon:yes gene_type:complete